VTNPEPLPLEQRLRQNHSGGPILRTKRHVMTTPYPNDRRTQDRARKRPWQKSNGSGPTTLEIRKIPVESNTISKLNEHFSKFGTVTNVQIAFDGSPDSALVAYSTPQQAETAYKNPEPLFNNRFIKIFWHNPEKNSTNTSSDVSVTKKPNPINSHWPKTEKPPPPPPKKKSTIPPGPSIIKKEAAKKAAIEIRRKKHGLLEEQIQQQKLLLKKLETAETNEEKESIRALMKQMDSTIVTLKDSFRTVPIKSISKLSQQDLLKQRAEKLKKELEKLRAKTSADMRRAMSNTLETKLPHSTPANTIEEDEEERLLSDKNTIT
jgi:RNA-binding protein 26